MSDLRICCCPSFLQSPKAVSACKGVGAALAVIVVIGMVLGGIYHKQVFQSTQWQWFTSNVVPFLKGSHPISNVALICLSLGVVALVLAARSWGFFQGKSSTLAPQEVRMASDSEEEGTKEDREVIKRIAREDLLRTLQTEGLLTDEAQAWAFLRAQIDAHGAESDTSSE